MKRGQLQTLEPIIIVIVLVLIAALVLMAFVRLTDASTPLDNSEAVAVLERVSTMPELSCPVIETAGTYCIDLAKVEAFSRIMRDEDNRIAYQPVFGFTQITLEVVGDDPILLYDMIDPEADVRAGTTYFTVHDPLTDTRRFATITVRRET